MIRRFLYLRLLRAVLVLGALYDLGFSLLMLWAPGIPSRWLEVPLPAEPFWLELTAIFLLMLGFLYAAAAREPRRYSAVILVAIGGRLLGALVLGGAAWSRPELGGLWTVAALDLVLAVATAWFWRAWRR